MLVPKEMKLEHSTSAIKKSTDEELEQRFQAIRAMLAAQAERQRSSKRPPNLQHCRGRPRSGTPAQAVQSIA